MKRWPLFPLFLSIYSSSPLILTLNGQSGQAWCFCWRGVFHAELGGQGFRAFELRQVAVEQCNAIPLASPWVGLFLFLLGSVCIFSSSESSTISHDTYWLGLSLHSGIWCEVGLVHRGSRFFGGELQRAGCFIGGGATRLYIWPFLWSYSFLWREKPFTLPENTYTPGCQQLGRSGERLGVANLHKFPFSPPSLNSALCWH